MSLIPFAPFIFQPFSTAASLPARERFRSSLHRMVRSLAREKRDKCELSLRLGLRFFLVFFPFFIRQPLTFDDLALPTLVEFESKQKRSFEKPPVRIILNSFDI